MALNSRAANPTWNPLTGGVGNMTSSQLQNVQLPPKLKCFRCNKFKNHEAFSKKQLNEARFQISKYGSKVKLELRCGVCSGGQVQELHCGYCNITKGLECFAKTHRKNPDDAKCKKCIDEQLDFNPNEVGAKLRPKDDSDEEPDLSDSDSDDSNPYEYADTTATDDDDTSSTMGNLSINDSGVTTASETGSNLTTSYFSSSNGRSSQQTPLNTSGRGSSGGVVLPQVGLSGWQTAPSTRMRKGVSSSTGANSSAWSGTSTLGATSKSQTESARRFPRIPAYKPPKPKQQEEDENEEPFPHNSSWLSDSDDASDSDDD